MKFEMKLNKKSFVLMLGLVLFIGLFLVVTVGSKDSEENQLERRLDAFMDVLPEDLRSSFLEGRYDEATALLSERAGAYRAWQTRLPEEKRAVWLMADFKSLPADVVEACPEELRKFYKGYFRIRDAECIHGFTDAEVITFFRVYFVEKLARIRGEDKQLKRRLDAFMDVLPEDIRSSFLEGRYDEATALLSERAGAYRAWQTRLPEEKRAAWLMADFKSLPADVVKACPEDLRKFYKGYFRIRDEESIHDFTDAEVIAFFRIYILEKLARIKGK